MVQRIADAPPLRVELWKAGWPIFPAAIFEHLEVGEPARRCWELLYYWAGCKAGHVKCSAADLMKALNVEDKRTVRHYVKDLAELGAIAIIDNGKHWVLYVNEPTDVASGVPRVIDRGRYRYLDFMLEPADEGGTFCAKSAALQNPPLAAHFAQNPPESEIVNLRAAIQRRQAEATRQVAPQAPPPAGEHMASRVQALARHEQERSHQYVQYQEQELQERSERSSFEGGENNLRGQAGELFPPAVNLFHELKALTSQLQALLGDTVGDYGWKLASYALLVLDGLIDRSEFAKIIAERIEPAELDRRGGLLHGCMMRQLALQPEAKLRALNLWDDTKSRPQPHRFKRHLPNRLREVGVPGMNLEQQLRALGIRWCARDGASWQRRGQHYRPDA